MPNQHTYTIPLQVGLDLMAAFRQSHFPGRYAWEVHFPKSLLYGASRQISFDYAQFSAIVWALLNSVNDEDLPYADRKNSYATLGEFAENFGIHLPPFKVPGYPEVTMTECKG